MVVRESLLSLILLATSASSVEFHKAIKANSHAGRKILRHAKVVNAPKQSLRRMEEEVEEEQADYEQNQYDAENEENEQGQYDAEKSDQEWMAYYANQQYDIEEIFNEDIEIEGLAGMYIKYEGCSEYQQYDENQAQRNAYNQNNQNQASNYQKYGNYNNYMNAQQAEYEKYGDRAENDGLERSLLVRFTLCNSADCGYCQGEYATDMETFVDAYAETMMSDGEYMCDAMGEECENCYGYSDCLSACYAENGMDFSVCEAYRSSAYYDLSYYIKCGRVRFYAQNNYYQQQNQQQYQQQNEGQEDGENVDYGYANGGGNYDYQNNQREFYYLGLTCVGNNAIYTKAFYDNQCSWPADQSRFKDAIQGSNVNLPYYNEPVISSGTCISCMEVERQVENAENGNYNGNNNNNDDGDANEVCEQSVGNAAACDRQRGISSGCGFLSTLPTLDGRRDWSSMYANVVERLKKTERLTYISMGALVLVVGTCVAMLGYICSGGGKLPRHRAALLEYRRENARSID